MAKKHKAELIEISAIQVKEFADDIVVLAEKKGLDAQVIAAALILLLDALKETCGFELQTLSREGEVH